MLRFISLFFLGIFPFSTHAYFHYPEERTYGKADKGYTQYGAPSLHQTGKYALTFDDGPHPVYTPKILDALKKSNTKATFFILTSKLNDSNFPIIKRMLDEGHIVASHGRSHDNSNTLSETSWKAGVKQSFQDLNRIYKRAGHKFTKYYYRFPYAAYGTHKDYHHLNALKDISKELMGENCIHFSFWDIDSGDWIPKMSGAEVFANFKASNEGGEFTTYKTIKNAQGNKTQIKVNSQIEFPTSGGVILQHDIQKSTLDAMESILNYISQNNLEVIALDEVEEFKITKNCFMKP